MRTVRLALCFAALVAGPMVAAPARAQSAEGAPDQATAEFPRISDDEETIYAVQRKAYIVKDKWEITPMFGLAFNDRFVSTLSPAASVTYHIAENFGIELYGGVMLPTESSLTEEILIEYKLTPEVAKLTQMLWAAGIGFQWSPIYGKVHIFDEYLGNFAIYVGAGLGTGQTRVRCTPGNELDPNRGFDGTCPAQTDQVSPLEVNEVYEPATFKLMGSISGGIRFNFSNSIGLKVEVRDYIFSSRVFRPQTSDASTQRFTDAIRNNVFAQIGVSFLLGGEDN
ncbi:MAG: outer membrane beta-barrel domain-containing protein [Myxococcota bacterium]